MTARHHLRLAAVNGAILPPPTPAAIRAAQDVASLTDAQVSRAVKRLLTQRGYEAARRKSAALQSQIQARKSGVTVRIRPEVA
jgi:hypothetical protein